MVFGLLGVLLLLIILVVAAALYFSPSRIEKTVKPLVAEAIQGEFDFSIARFNVLTGFVFKDIRLTVSDSVQPAMPLRLLTAHEASLRYSLRRLLKRHLIIEEVLIDSPKIEMRVLLPPEAQQVTDADTTAPQLPIDFDLKRLRLINAEISIDARDSLTAYQLFLSEIDLYLNELRIPRGDVLTGDSLLSGRVEIVLNQSSFFFRQQTADESSSCSGILDAFLNLSVESLSDIRANSSFCLREIGVLMNDQLIVDTRTKNIPLTLALAARLDLPQERALIDSLCFQVQEIKWLEFALEANSLMTRPFIAGRVTRGVIPIAQLLSLAPVLAPDLPLPEIYLHNPQSVLDLSGAAFSGALPDSSGDASIFWTAPFGLKNFGVTINFGESLVRNLDVSAVAEGGLNYLGLVEPKVHFELTYDSLVVTLPEAQVFSGALKFQAAAALNEQMLPASAQLALDIANLLGADISAALNLQTPSNLQQLRGSGSFSLNRFDLSQVLEGQAVGRVSAKMDISVGTLDSIKTQFVLKTDSVTTLLDGQLLTWSPLAIASQIRLSTDTLFQRIALRNMSVTVNDFLKGELAASLQLTSAEEMSGSADLETLSIDHAALLDWLPAEMMQPLEGLEITGITELAADVMLKVQPDDTTFDINARLVTLPTNLHFAFQNLFINNIQMNSRAALNSESGGNFEFVLLVDSTVVPASTPMQFLNNTVGIRISLPDFQTVNLDTGYLSLPDFQTHGFVKGRIENLLTDPVVTARLEFHQAAEDTLVFGKDIFFKGYNDLTLALQANKEQARVDLSAKVSDLSIYLPNDIRVSRVNADISFSQEVDLQNMAAIGYSAPIVQTPSDGLIDYFLYRNYYAGNLNKSRLYVRKVEAAGYTVENIFMDAYLGNGRIEIPYFALDVYGGNIGGQFVLAAGEHDPLDATYRLSAHFSGINSALLVPSAKMTSRGIITAHTELRGRGLDVQKGIDLDGHFNISQIESKVADNLLRSLDPEGKDSGIRSTRILINRGFKPRLFRFEIRHGFCYPAVYFDQPWYFPVRLSGGAIELSRIPVASLLKIN